MIERINQNKQNIQNKPNFRNARNEYKSSNSNNYEQKTTNSQLRKTNPIKPNFASPNLSNKILIVRQFQIIREYENPILNAELLTLN
jgi:hypothetical protein